MNLINLHNIKITMIYLFIIVLPINLFSSGKPQIHHFIAILLLLLSFILNKNIMNVLLKNIFIILLFIYTVLIDFIFYYYTSDISLARGMLYNIFNISVFLTFVLIYNMNNKVVTHLRNSAVIAIIIQTFLTIMFYLVNNYYYAGLYSIDHLDLLSKSKNSLGFVFIFYSFIIFYYYFNKQLLTINLFNKYILFFLIFFILILNQSIGSLLSCTILILVSIFLDLKVILKKNFYYLIFLILILSTATYFLLVIYFEFNISHKSILTQIYYDFLNRGYVIFLDFNSSYFFGNGDQKNLGSNYSYLAIHSLPVYILFSYGLVGILFFLAHILYLLQKNTILVTIFLISFMPFVLTHNVMFNTLFWIAFSFLSFHKNRNNNNYINQ